MSEELRGPGILLRTAAKAVDFILIVAVAAIIPKAGHLAGLAYLLLGDGFGYGESIGKKLINLRVVSIKTDGPCSFKDSILRNSTLAAGYIFWFVPWVGWIFSILIFALEFILVLGSRDGKRLGDELADTIVIKK